MTQYLQSLLADPFNKFCVDCTKNESTHANISHGTFVCLACANLHQTQLGMDKTYIKPIFEDLWDQYQMQVVTLGGNKLFWEFMKEYRSEQKPIATKYLTAEAQFYKRRLAAIVQDNSFLEKAPARNFDELVDKSLDQGKVVLDKSAVALTKVGNAIEQKLQ